MKNLESKISSICKNTEIKDTIIQRTVEIQHGSITGLKRALARRDKIRNNPDPNKQEKKVQVFAHTKKILEDICPQFNFLTAKEQKTCCRDMSRELERDVWQWIAEREEVKTNTPPVNSDYKGLEKMFNIGNESLDQLSFLEKCIAMKPKSIKTPDGWEIIF
ncbi:hypothetical protein RW110999_151 [Cyanophage S-RIM4]|nr:hypothetical protein RW110999_151 [Cyanophage S-RIM4]